MLLVSCIPRISAHRGKKLSPLSLWGSLDMECAWALRHRRGCGTRDMSHAVGIDITRCRLSALPWSNSEIVLLSFDSLWPPGRPSCDTGSQFGTIQSSCDSASGARKNYALSSILLHYCFLWLIGGIEEINYLVPLRMTSYRDSRSSIRDSWIQAEYFLNSNFFDIVYGAEMWLKIWENQNSIDFKATYWKFKRRISADSCIFKPF